MIFKSIHLHNFRQFKDNEVITFSTDSVNNITLFIADNNVGKTTLLQAFLWCLYGEVKLDSANNLANIVEFNKLKIGGIIEVSVQLELLSEAKEYIIKRKVIVTKNKDFEQEILTKPDNQVDVFVKLENGTTMPTDFKVIERLFPKDLSDYFFFDGERMKALGASNTLSRKDISHAVKNIFNLDVLEKVDKNIKDILDSWDSQKNVARESSALFEQTKNDIKQNEIKLQRDQKQLQEAETQQSKYNEIIKRNEEYLFDKKMLTAQLQSRKYLESNLRLTEKRILDLKSEIKRDFLRNTIELQLSTYLNETKLALRSFDSDNKMISGINSNAIKEIIKRKKCICGQELFNDDCHIKELNNLLNYLPPENIGILLKSLINTLENKRNNRSSILNSVYSKVESLNNEYQNQNDVNEGIIKINKDIEKIIENYDEIQIAEKRLAAAKKNNDELHPIISRLRKNIEIYIFNLAKLRRTFDRLTEEFSSNKKLFKRIEILEGVRRKIKEDINKQDAKIRYELTSKVQFFMDNIMKTKYTIKIDRQYNFTIFDNNNNQVTGEGYKVVVSFAYIAGLIDLVNEKIINFTLPESFPLVMDAPFAKLDDNNRRSINRILPKIARQVILFTTDSQWSGSVEGELQGVLGKKYEMKNYVNEEVENGITRITEVI